MASDAIRSAILIDFPKETLGERLRGIQQCLSALQREVQDLEDPLLAHLIGCCAKLAAERATEWEENFVRPGSGHPQD